MNRLLLTLGFLALSSICSAQETGTWVSEDDWNITIGMADLTPEGGFTASRETDHDFATLSVSYNAFLYPFWCWLLPPSWEVHVERADIYDWPDSLVLSMRTPSGEVIALDDGSTFEGEGCDEFQFGYRLDVDDALLPAGTYLSNITLTFRP